MVLKAIRMNFKRLKFTETELVALLVVFCYLLSRVNCCSSSGKSNDDKMNKTIKGKRHPGNILILW